MQAHYRLLVLISFIFLFTSCSLSKDAVDKNEVDGAEDVEEVTAEQEPELETTEEEEVEEITDYRLDIGNLEIWIGGEVIVEEDKVIVAGESNLLPGARIASNAVSDGWAVIAYQDSTEVEEDGSFYFEFPGREKDTFVTLSLSTGNSNITDQYGGNLEKAIGNQVYKTDTEGVYAAKYTFDIDVRKEMPYTIELETPDWSNVPSDYGDTDVWMEVEYTTKHNFLYFEGKSNLLEGARINGGLSDPGDLLSSAWSFENTTVHPDGTFQMRIHYWDIRKGTQMHFEFVPSNSNWESILHTYGEEGENLEGILVKERENGEQYILLSVEIDLPDMNPPEKVDLSFEDEEIKMQVPDNLLFDFDESKLKAEAKETLNGIIEELRDLPDGTVIQINGHTDNVGEANYNVNLSKERAQAVADYIQEQGDLDTLSIQIEGFGDTKPIESNEEESGREKNRRVEIVINPQ